MQSEQEPTASAEADADAELAPTAHDKPVYVVGVDGSASSRRAVEFAARRAAANDGRVWLVHVVDWSPYTFTSVQENEQRHARREEEIKAANEGLAPLVEVARNAGASVETEVRHGHPADTLVRIAHEHRATHILVGRTGQSRIRSMVFGSTPSHLIQVADVPVTVVP